MKQPLIVIGTRPEAVKLAPVILALRGRCDARVVLTGQHEDMVRPVLHHFGIDDCELWRKPFKFGETCDWLRGKDCDGYVVQGDTFSVVAGALAAFYSKKPLVHVEAGLTSGNLREPYPEEFNRRVVSLAATVHCAPTMRAEYSLKMNGFKNVHCTGNTVVDALRLTKDKLGDVPQKKRVLVTCHRRENLDGGIENVYRAVVELAWRFQEHSFIWPAHPNPAVQAVVKNNSAVPNLRVCEPLPYADCVKEMLQSQLILTDSGGIQEEAACLGRRTLVLRNVTERPESLEWGGAELVGTDVDRIVEAASKWLENPVPLLPCYLYGDGMAAGRIADLVLTA